MQDTECNCNTATCERGNELEFSKLKPTDQELLRPYFELRDIDSCEYCFATFVLWDNRYNVSYHTAENYALFMEEYEGETYAVMPVCKEEHFDEALEALRSHFKAIEEPFVIYVADKVFADYISAHHEDRYEVTTDRDQYDYLYDAQALRTLAGKKLRKKRNHVNGFLRDYEGRWRYEELGPDHKGLICGFMKQWAEQKGETDEMLEQELEGVCELLQNMERIELTVGGIFIDDGLAALTMGSRTNGGKEAVVHIEKADPTVRGLYQMINQQFLINSMPEVEVVNREDDVGIEGLRKAKMSYYPIGFAEKYTIREK